MPAIRNVINLFPSTHGHGCTKFFQTSGGRETTPALRMTTKTLIKQTSFVVKPLKYFKNTLFSYKTSATTMAETSRHRNGFAETGSPKCPRPGYLCLWDAFATFAEPCISHVIGNPRINDASTTTTAFCLSQFLLCSPVATGGLWWA